MAISTFFLVRSPRYARNDISYEIATLPMVVRNDIGSSNFGTVPIIKGTYAIQKGHPPHKSLDLSKLKYSIIRREKIQN